MKWNNYKKMIIFNKKKLSIGALGEKIAEKYLKKKGFKILELNFQNKKGKRVGEIDIISKENDQIVFVEVKTRLIKKNEKSVPEENITRRKLQKLEKIAQVYLKENNEKNVPYRFDAVSIILDSDKRILETRHLESIFL